MKSHALNVKNVVFHRKNKTVLDHVSLSVRAGSIIGLLGANGAGKTTLFDIVCGLRTRQSGQVSGVRADRIAYLTQVVTVPDALKLGEMARLVYGLCAVPKNPTTGVFEGSRSRILEKFKMLWDRRANSCSYGEKRWFVVMVILSLDADLYLLDEPTAGVDAEYRFYLWEALARVKAQGKSVLFSTHMVTEIEHHCDGFYFLKGGSLRRFNSAAQLVTEYGGKTVEEAFVRYVTQ
ncbi:ATP-binding cassette domain-containing protein [Achromobacter aloeverae]|nr:ABC transporter ATP-binding protein [Achromobacter aloeverae]